MSTTNFQIKDSSSVSASNTNLLNSSGMALSYFPNPEQIKNERESLSRIHTFSLKEQVDEAEGETPGGERPADGAENNILAGVDGTPAAGRATDAANQATANTRGGRHGSRGGNLSMD